MCDSKRSKDSTETSPYSKGRHHAKAAATAGWGIPAAGAGYGDHNRPACFTMTPLQMSALAWFVPCAAVAYRLGESALAGVLIAVAATSMLVHSRNRTSENVGAVDVADAAAVGCWMVACAELFLRVDRGSREGRQRSLAALACFVGVVTLNVVRQRVGPWKSTARRVTHVAMHGVGVGGTLVMLLAPRGARI